MHTTPTRTVSAIGKMNFTGNIIPANWWRHVVLPSKKPDSTAIVLLSDIVYWYRPAEVRDEFTGAIVGYRKRFHGDKLQRSYQSFADQFGFTKRETTDALKRLRDAGLVTLELRTIKTTEGLVMNNVLYVEPVADAIAVITNSTPPTLKRNSPHVETEVISRSDVNPPTLKRETNTENTTEITTEIITDGESADADTQQPADQKINYQVILDTYHEILPEMPPVKILTDGRKKHLRTFWKKFNFNESRWRAYLEFIGGNCRWMLEDRPNGRGGFWRRKNLDYLITERCYVSVKEERANDK